MATILLVMVAVCCFSSCDDETGSIGPSVLPSNDKFSTSDSIFYAHTKSILIDSLLANTSQCYLGRVTDPETGATTTSNFLAQFYCLENYELPDIATMYKEDGLPVADSVDINLYINTYYGDSLNSMKIAIMELDSAHIMAEETVYYTNLDPAPYLSKRSDAIYQEMSFAVVDLEVSDSLRYSSSYSKHINIKLPREYGSRILQQYYQHPEYFKNSYNFIHHVMPGFYFKVISGNGTMVNIDISTLSIYFNYTVNDSTYVGVSRVAATQEVLQNNSISNKDNEALLGDTACTYLKTPAGIFTEVTLPIDSIYQGHDNDSINSAKIVFKRQNNDSLRRYSLAVPSELLMIPKKEMDAFFEKHQLPNGTTSFISTYNSAYNSYSYENIATLVSYLKRMHNNDGDDDWYKVVLIPVKTEVNGTNTYTKVYHDFSLSSTKLVGSTGNPISISVIYSHFK
ncbi:MAG: DUF4270 domain-containing protein [Bacteroidaceae bacterium]|nr:DUF4270 domain-containing protein [Bacteroidaceae bacterium]